MTRQPRGFTLVEVIVAITVLGLMMTLIGSSIATGIRAEQVAAEVAENHESLRIARRFLRRQLSYMTHTVFDLSSAGARTHRVTFRGSGKSMTFVSPLPGYAGPGGPHVHRLLVEDNGQGKVLKVSMSVPPAPDALRKKGFRSDFSNSETVTLASDLTDVGFDYFRFDAGTHTGRWVTLWEEEDGLPDLVRISVTPQDDDPWPTLVISPRSRVPITRDRS